MMHKINLSAADHTMSIALTPQEELEQALAQYPEGTVIVASAYHAKLAVAKLLNLFPYEGPYLISKTRKKICVIFDGVKDIYKVPDKGADIYVVVTFDRESQYTIVGFLTAAETERLDHLWTSKLHDFNPDMIYI